MYSDDWTVAVLWASVLSVISAVADAAAWTDGAE